MAHKTEAIFRVPLALPVSRNHLLGKAFRRRGQGEGVSRLNEFQKARIRGLTPPAREDLVAARRDVHCIDFSAFPK